MRMNVVFLNVSGCDSEIQNFGIKCLKKTTLEFPVLIYKVLHHGKKNMDPKHNGFGNDVPFIFPETKMARENWCLGWETTFPFGKAYFQGLC